jgi:Ku70/Ku80 beta-barrel domain
LLGRVRRFFVNFPRVFRFHSYLIRSERHGWPPAYLRFLPICESKPTNNGHSSLFKDRRSCRRTDRDAKFILSRARTQTNDPLHREDPDSFFASRICTRLADPGDKIDCIAARDRGVIKDEDFARVDEEATQTVDIINFVAMDEVDPLLFFKPYYLETGKGGDKAYVLLRDALVGSRKIAVARDGHQQNPNE